MNKVEITIAGKQALVDADQVKLLLKKEALVAEAMSLRQQAYNMTAYEHMVKAGEITGQIIKLNRRIRKNVQFVKA